MKQLILLFSHKLTLAQEMDAREHYGIDEFTTLPKELQRLWSNVPPDIELLDKYLSPIKAFVDEVGSSGDSVLVQGDFGATCEMVGWAKSMGMVALYATTKRNTVEKSIDGKIVKTSVFEHVRFREFR
ncbi:MAG: CRISPR-associated protein Csx20 [Campylobacterota bacterium]|nr:CRISPR-associated protein Csx20 [Campylobacterota bacterium]